MVGQTIFKKLDKYRFDNIGGGYAPAHITGIFEIHIDNPEPVQCGSRGIGLCIDKGVYSYVITKKSNKQLIDIFMNGQEIFGKTTRTTIFELIGDLKVEVQVFNFTELPLSQGFGISGATGLSTAIALNSAMDLNLDYGKLVNAAHNAEIQNFTGLGDVVAQATGGIVNRKKEGGYNFGEVEKLEGAINDSKLVLCVLGERLETSDIISNQKYIKKINKVGKKYLDKIQKLKLDNKVSMVELIKLSYKFSIETGLVGHKLEKLINKIHKEKIGFASMIMLGNAIFIAGDILKIKKMCSKFSQSIICRIDSAPARQII